MSNPLSDLGDTEGRSDAQLEAIIARGIEGGLDPAAPDQDAQIIQ